MEKINGFYKDEVIRLIDFIKTGKEKGICLSQLFEDYGNTYGRAKGSVRNFYYQLLKQKNHSSSVKGLLKDTDLKAEKIVEFSDAETRELIRNILRGKAAGRSVRSVIKDLSKGNDKLMLRLQNKYRNILKSRPDLIESAVLELKGELGEDIFKKPATNSISDFAIKRLQKEINSLYNKLSESLKKENRTLKERLMRLESENVRLRILTEENIVKEKNKSRIFFERDKKHIN